jgi:hypothetical protein
MMMHLGTFAPVAFASALTQGTSGKKARESSDARPSDSRPSDARPSEPTGEARPLDPDFGVCMICLAPCVECMKREAEAQSRS